MSKMSAAEFVRKSLELHLFFLRIMKEHSLFLEAAFVPPNRDLAITAEEFMLTYNLFLTEAVDLANGNVGRAVLNSGEVVTDKTAQAEEKTEILSGIDIDLALTAREASLKPGNGDPALERKVADLNARVIRVTRALVDFKTKVLLGMLSCRIYTFNFPLLIEHIRREAMFYIEHLERLQNRVRLDPVREIIEEKRFWDLIMAEHSLFIAHLLDPTETALIKQADEFAVLFNKLEERVQDISRASKRGNIFNDLIKDEIRATRAIRNFKNTAEDLILACRIRSIIIPLLADHVLREADHFLRLLTHFPLQSESASAITAGR